MNNQLPNTMENVSIIYERNLASTIGPAKFLIFTLTDFLQWWYKSVIPRLIQRLKRILLLIDDRLSISLLLKTFFVPWHRDNNPVGYGVGFVVRLMYLPVGFILIITVSFVGILFILFGFLLPVLPLISIILPILLSVS